MNRRHFIKIAGAAVLAASPALADSYSDAIVRQLSRQGFAKISIERTLLGRVRILATGSEGRREIIVNPRTGEILRDLWTANSNNRSGGSRQSGLIDDDGRQRTDNSGSGSRDDRNDDKNDDRDDDRDDDKDEKDDNSGSGSSNSGSGGGSGGGGSDDDDDSEDD